MAMTATAFPHRPGPDLVLDTLREHAASLLGTARRYSICTDDAHDAYQRALEIFLKRAHRLDREGALPWLRTVVKHEALAVRAARQRLLGGGDVDLDARENREAATPEECAADADALTRSAEALQRLKPQEVRALLLKAQGHSYREIGEITGWSYTKVNRCLTEGRKAFLERFAGLESGDECARWTPVVSALVDGEISLRDARAVRRHLRHCGACRSTVRELRAAGPSLAGVLPGAAVVGGGDTLERAGGLVARAYEALAGGLHDRVGASVVKLQAAAETASAGKVAAVAASAAAIATGGAVTAHEARTPTAHEPGAVARVQRAHRHARPHHVRIARVTRPVPVRVSRSAPRRTGPRRAAVGARARRTITAREFGLDRTRARAASAAAGPAPRPRARPASNHSAEFGFESAP